jgi:isopenicillin N synthase-like dioxygenase
MPNFSESFYISRDREPDHPDIVNKKAADRALTAGRSGHAGVPRCHDGLFTAAMEAMTTRLVPVFRGGARATARLFRRSLRRAHCTIRLIHYPPQLDPGDNEFGFAPHTDNKLHHLSGAIGTAGA